MSWNSVKQNQKGKAVQQNLIYVIVNNISVLYVCMQYKHWYINLFKVAYGICKMQIICSVFILVSPYYFILYSASWNLHQSENLYYGLGEDSLFVNNILTKYLNGLLTGGMDGRIILKWMWKKQCCVHGLYLCLPG